MSADTGSRMNAFARKAISEIGTTPGLAVVVVKDDRVIYRGEFGLRDVEAKLAVTPDTRFYMASSTKAFTAMTAAILAERGRLDLDAPVADLWPELKLTPPLDTHRLSLRDFLAMRSGVGNDTINFRMDIGNLDDEAELLRLLATYSREEPRVFRYSNMSYIVAARVLEKAAGKPWATLVTETILAPLGMTGTTTQPAPDPLAARTYRTNGDGAFTPVPHGIPAIAAPAGGMLTTTADAARWLIAMMNDGRIGQEQLLPARAVRLVQSEQTTNTRRFRYVDRFAWGLGQDLAEYEGELLVHRFGGLNGAYSHVSFMPERRIGVAVFSNGGGAVPDAVAAYAYDLLLGRKDLDAKWSAEIAKVVAAGAEAREKRAAASTAGRRLPAHDLAAYAGRYHYDRLGDIDVTIDEGRLYARLGAFRAEAMPAGGDEFLVDWTDRGEPFRVSFVVAGDRAARIDWGGRIFDRVE